MPVPDTAPEPAAGCLTGAEVLALLAGDLSPDRRRRAAEHLAACAACRQEVADRRDFDDLRQAFQALGVPPLPPVVDKFVLLSFIGQGGQGAVWLARHEPLDQLRALKVLRRDRFHPAALAGLCAEARLMARLKPHANRVQVFDLIEQPDDVVLVLGYVEGGPLSRLAPLPWERAVRHVADAALGLVEVHAAGLLHRDVKPANLFWDCERDQVLLGDFGLAAFADRQESRGWTLGYAAPEALEGAATVQSDVFGLAASLYHLLAGRPPFPAVDHESGLAAVRAGLPAPAPELAHIPRAVEEVIRAGLEPDPARRPGLDEFRARLRGVHTRELAEELRRLAERSPCTTHLRVSLAAASPREKQFAPLVPGSAAEGGVCRVHPGELLRIEATADADGYLTILNFGASGELDVLLPNPQVPDNALAKDKPQRLTVQMTPPGPDHAAVIWTRSPNRLTAAEWRDRIAGGRIAAAERGMEFLLHESAVERPEDWTAVVVTVAQQGAGD
jgi:tRNA A-37 threonylcarbamoyl transferase component Bud32